MSEWITYRLPEYEEGFSGLVWGQLPGREPYLRNRKDVELGEPWMPIIAPEPYVKTEPKRWTVRFNGDSCWKWQTLWALYDWDLKCASLPGLSSREDHAEAAQRIADIYNEVMP